MFLKRLVRPSAGVPAFEGFDWFFSLSCAVFSPGREGHFLYAGGAGLPQVQHWISFHEGTNQGSVTGASG